MLQLAGEHGLIGRKLTERTVGGTALGTIGYVSYRARAPAGTLGAASDLQVDEGICLATLTTLGESSAKSNAATRRKGQVRPIRTDAFFGGLSTEDPDLEVVRTEGDSISIISRLPAEVHRYLFSRDRIDPGVLLDPAATESYFECLATGVSVQLVLIYFDDADTRVGHSFLRPLQSQPLVIPSETTSVQVGLRIKGQGVANQLRYYPRPVLRTPPRGCNALQCRDRDAELPKYDDLYRSAFVHSRLRAYLQRGVRSDVFCCVDRQDIKYWEYENIDVAEGGGHALNEVLSLRRVRTVLVHFMNLIVWKAIRRARRSLRIVIWIHGFEAQSWWRRKHDLDSEEEVIAARKTSDERIAMWREIFGAADPRLHFVFVSDTFAEEVFTDVGIRLPPNRFSVIHNPIDTNLFNFKPKVAADAKRVLSVRPYASRTYANDLSVRAVLELSERPGFDELSFLFVGRGRLFDEVLRPIQGFRNVEVQERFLSQYDLADLHKRHGLVLVPTRADTHGVSRDEAMSSGLVPITTRLDTVSEFVSDKCAMLSAPEDFKGIATAIWTLAWDEERFLRMSAAAADRVRARLRQTLRFRPNSL